MIISPGRGFIFVHIPKTGGTSMALALEDRAHRDDILIGDTPKAQKRHGRVRKLKAAGRLWKHSTLSDIDGILTAEEIAGMFCVTLVRNPWDRLVSYYHWLQVQRFTHRAVTLAHSLSFEDFLRHPHTTETIRVWPARRYMTDVTGQEQADLYIRLENLEEDAGPLWDHLGFRLDLPRVNTSNRKPYQNYYTDDLAGHAAQTCAEDIARFNYSF